MRLVVYAAPGYRPRSPQDVMLFVLALHELVTRQSLSAWVLDVIACAVQVEDDERCWS